MLLPEKKEREYRFRLALRMGLPIFGLILVLVFTTLINNYDSLTFSFYVESLLLLVVSVYFILYLIYKGFDVAITDPVSKTFTREYLQDYLKEQIKSNDDYTLILIGVDNISDINTQYGIKNGDRVLQYVAQWIGEYLQEHQRSGFPIGRIKGGDFIIGLEGSSEEHKVLLDLFCLKGDELKFNNIEIKISSAITDTKLTQNLDHLFDTLFEQQEYNRYKKNFDTETIDPTTLELMVINAIENSALLVATQKVYDKAKNARFCELFIRMKTDYGKYIHQKKYMKVINKLGLTLDFDTMVVEKIFTNIDKFSQQKIALNISTTSLRDSSFYNKVEELVRKDETLRGRIVFLFCENEYYSKIDKFNAIIRSFRELGIELAVDRLGTLHSSFLYFRDLHVDMARFDSSYTKKERLERFSDIIAGFGVMAKAKNIQTWVKMVETNEQLEKLEALDIALYEGKLLSTMEEIEL